MNNEMYLKSERKGCQMFLEKIKKSHVKINRIKSKIHKSVF